MAETQFAYPSMPNWQKGKSQNVEGSEFVVIEPDSKWEDYPTQVSFQLESNKPYFFGPMTKFNVTGSFKQKKTKTTGWVPMAAGDAADVMLVLNWFEMLIKEITVYHGNFKICTNNEAAQIWPFLNAYLYANMDKLTKKLLCPHPESSGHCVPSNNNVWDFTNADWLKYGAIVFGQETINLDYTPLHVFPLYQNADYVGKGNYPCALPINALGKLEIRLSFRKDVECIFKKKDPASVVEYKFDIDNIQLCVEEARLSPSFDKAFLNSKASLPYPGVTKIMMAETISSGAMVYKTKFQRVLAPEGLFIFALPKDVIGGEWKFESLTDGQLFKYHNIKSVSLMYKGESYDNKEPNIGMIEDNFIEIKNYVDHFSHPPFGMPQDPDKLTLALLKNGGKDSIYPHGSVNLCNSLDKSRLVPINEDGSILLSEADLDINLKFNRGGATADVTYLMYLFYTDVNLILDMKTKTFSSPYVR